MYMVGVFFSFFTSFTFITKTVSKPPFSYCTVLTLKSILWLRGSHEDEERRRKPFGRMRIQAGFSQSSAA